MTAERYISIDGIIPADITRHRYTTVYNMWSKNDFFDLTIVF